MNERVQPIACRAMASFEMAVEEVRRHATEGRTVALFDIDRLDAQEALQLLDIFLHDRTLTGSIEPFGEILVAMLGKRSLGLWDLPLRESRSESHGRTTPEAFLEALPQSHAECLACSCFPVCEGYGQWAGSCATWMALIPRLARAARDLSELQRQGDAGRKGRRTKQEPRQPELQPDAEGATRNLNE